MKIVGAFLLSVAASAAACGWMADALGAAVPPFPRTPALPSSAASSPSVDTPAGATVPGAPAGSPRNLKSKPMPAPAPTEHYAGSIQVVPATTFRAE